MTFAFVKITQVGYTIVPFSFVQLVQKWPYSVGGTIATYVAVSSAVFLYPNNGYFDAIEVG